jgi:transposase-like protein
MKEEPLAGMLGGTVEVDESYFGGKARGRFGRGHPKKVPVLALVQRGGRAFARPVERVNALTLKGAIREVVNRKARIMTDDFQSYKGLDKEYAGHGIVRHTRGEYALGDTHTQTVESFFALMKRGVMGSFHHVSKKHLQRYCDEFSFRWNYRNVSDYWRTRAAIEGSGGKRLVYMEPVG